MRIIFIDNGVTGSIGMYDGESSEFVLTPVKKEQDYTKAKKNISRIDVPSLLSLLKRLTLNANSMVVLERPLVNPTRYSATISAVRALEATLCCIESLGLPYRFCDSKDWQRNILPSSGHKGTTSDVLKQESRDIGIRMFPQFRKLIEKHKDADGILGAYQWWKMESGKQ